MQCTDFRQTDDRNTFWTNRYKVSSFGMDMRCRATFQRICNYFWETAGNHVYTIHHRYKDEGREPLFISGQLWLLSRFFVNIIKYPVWNDTIFVSTWSKGGDRLFALRDFEIRNENGDIFAVSTSAWILVDFNSRKPVRLNEFYSKMPSLTDRHALCRKLEKIPSADNAVSQPFFPVMYDDLDLNNHVNNLKYIEWILSGYSYKIRNKYEIKNFEINYIAEAVYGDEISVADEIIADEPEPVFLHNAVRKSDGREVMRARIEWVPDRCDYKIRRRR